MTPLLATSLAHPSTDPPALVARAQRALGWHGSDFLVGLRGYDELMATLETAHDVEGLFRIGDPMSPHLRLLRALDRSQTGLRVTRVATLASPYRWTRVGGGTAPIAGVAVRQQAYADVVGLLGRAGVTFRVVPDATSTEALLTLAAELGSAVVDVDEVVDPAHVVAGWLDDAHPLDYGLVSREEPAGVDVVWLAMAPERESAGTLVTALERFSNRGFDLQFLHSDPQPTGVHDFYLGFGVGEDRMGGVIALQERLAQVGFTSKVLAAFARPEPA